MSEPILQIQQNQTNQSPSDQKDTDGDYFTPYTAGVFHLTNKNDLITYDSKFDFLSPSVERILFDFSTAEFIEENLGTRFNLAKEQKKEMANIIRDVLLGNIFIGDLVKAVQLKITVDQPKASEVVSSIVSELFPSIVESIKRIQRTKFPEKIMELQKGIGAAWSRTPAA